MRVARLLSDHLDDVVVGATVAVLRSVKLVRLSERCPQQAGSGVVEMGEETGRTARVGQGESPRAWEQGVVKHPGFREHRLAVAEGEAWREQVGHVSVEQVRRQGGGSRGGGGGAGRCRQGGRHGEGGGGGGGENGGQRGRGRRVQGSVPGGRLSQHVRTGRGENALQVGETLTRRRLKERRAASSSASAATVAHQQRVTHVTQGAEHGGGVQARGWEAKPAPATHRQSREGLGGGSAFGPHLRVAQAFAVPPLAAAHLQGGAQDVGHVIPRSGLVPRWRGHRVRRRLWVVGGGVA